MKFVLRGIILRSIMFVISTF